MSQGTLRKLGCQSGDAVEYRKANIWNVLWAKKWIAALAILGFIIAVAQAIISLASLTPTPKHTPERNSHYCRICDSGHHSLAG